jgi:hypothetical protein
LGFASEGGGQEYYIRGLPSLGVHGYGDLHKKMGGGLVVGFVSDNCLLNLLFFLPYMVLLL